MSHMLGKAPAVQDKKGRTLKLSTILKAPEELPTIPEQFTFQSAHELPFGCYGNDVWGNCVRVAIANQTLALEDDEQDKVIKVTQEDILKKYWKQQGWCSCLAKPVPGGRFDNGLVVLDTLVDARKHGWRTGGKTYKLHAFASVPVTDHRLVKAGSFLLNGLLIGINLPLTAQDQLGKTWEYQPWKKGSEAGSWGGHLVWNKDFPYGLPNVITWGKDQEMTWEFAEHYVDEIYAVVDAPNCKESILNLDLLKSYLKAVGKS